MMLADRVFTGRLGMASHDRCFGRRIEHQSPELMKMKSAHVSYLFR